MLGFQNDLRLYGGGGRDQIPPGPWDESLLFSQFYRLDSNKSAAAAAAWWSAAAAAAWWSAAAAWWSAAAAAAADLRMLTNLSSTPFSQVIVRVLLGASFSLPPVPGLDLALDSFTATWKMYLCVLCVYPKGFQVPNLRRYDWTLRTYIYKSVSNHLR